MAYEGKQSKSKAKLLILSSFWQYVCLCMAFGFSNELKIHKQAFYSLKAKIVLDSIPCHTAGFYPIHLGEGKITLC